MECYDIGIVGAGIIGCTLARELSRYQLKVAVFEAKSDVGAGATRGNGGFIHAGYDPEPGTLKARFNAKGCTMYPGLAKELDFPYQKTGAMVVGFDETDLAYIEQLYEKGKKNGVSNLEIISGERIFQLEPQANPDIKYALYSPDSAVTEPYITSIAFMENAITNGVELYRNCKVNGITKKEDLFILHTAKGDFKVKYLVNAAGIYADEISAMAGAEEFKLLSRHGELLIFDNNCGIKMTMSLFPIPTAFSKGVAIGTKISGNPSLGSTSVFKEKGDLENTREGIDALLSGAARSVPAIGTCKVIRMFSGERAVLDQKNDFYISPSQKVNHMIQIAGIQSPGVAAAPAIAVYAAHLLEEMGVNLVPDKDFWPKRRAAKRFSEMSDEERQRMIQDNPAYGRIVCRCEVVTEGDILTAIREPVGATTIGGVKRRVRAGMGRCQGGFCQQKVIEILAQELGIQPWEVLLEEEGSNPLLAELKGGQSCADG